MAFYIPAYDTEAAYPWWQAEGRPYSAQLYKQIVSYEGEALRECLAGIRAVADRHLEQNAPATFFLVAELVVHAAHELVKILDHPLFDIQCHTYSHANLLELADDEPALRREIADARQIIEDAFGRAVIGLTTPGAFSAGLAGQKRVLAVVWDAGYRYVRSLGKGPFDSVPAPLTQPFWYSDDGYPRLLELAAHAWHDNVLSGQPFVCHWPPILPWGYPSHAPKSWEEMYEAYAPGIDYVADNNLTTYIPCFHPWSIYRVDPQARHIGRLLQHAQERLTLESCTNVYQFLRNHNNMASPSKETASMSTSSPSLPPKPSFSRPSRPCPPAPSCSTPENRLTPA